MHPPGRDRWCHGAPFTSPAAAFMRKRRRRVCGHACAMEIVRLGRAAESAAPASTCRSAPVRVARRSAGLSGGRSIDCLWRRSIESPAALGARLEIRLSWNGEALDRLLDADHAGLVEVVVKRLQAAGWECAVEVSFNIRGERGAVDVHAFHSAAQILLVVEVKSVIPDVQAMLMTLDRKARLGRAIAQTVGWSATGVGRLLVVGESRTSRRRVDTHAAVFAATLPSRAIAIRAWLAEPRAQPPFSALLFLSPGPHVAARHRVQRRRGRVHAGRAVGP
jgi:hypothetical protein